MKKSAIIIAALAVAMLANAGETRTYAESRKMIAQIRELKAELAKYYMLDAGVRPLLKEKLEKAKKSDDTEGQLSAHRQLNNFDSAHDCEKIWLWIDETRYPNLDEMELALRRCILKYKLIGYTPRNTPIEYEKQKSGEGVSRSPVRNKIR